MPSTWRNRFVMSVYATHNKSPAIQRALKKCFLRVEEGERGLNIGSGPGSKHAHIINLDIEAMPNVDCCARAEALPFVNNTFRVVVSQETLEHVRDPFKAVSEVFRVLRPGGTFYCQVPFVIGYHPGPTDFWRFTRQGIDELVRQAGFECEEIGIAVGTGTGMYRITVEFWAVLASVFYAGLYLPAKGFFALILTPLKWLDSPLARSPQASRIPGGYYVIALKPE